MTSIFDQGLAPVDANYAVQSPVDFIERTATVYPEYPAVRSVTPGRRPMSAVAVWPRP
jgi:hypothetical protein